MMHLETERLVIREMRRSDVESLHLLFSNPLFMRFWPVFDRDKTERWVEESMLNYTQHGFGLWALTLRGSDEAISDCGLDFIKGLEDAGDTDQIQIGWHVRRDLWGQGLATEAALACRDHGLGTLGFARLISLIAPGNDRSVRVAEKIGSRYVRDVSRGDWTARLFSVQR
jgi:RimJ/RimL family protein N-acetyltransferase